MIGIPCDGDVNAGCFPTIQQVGQNIRIALDHAAKRYSEPKRSNHHPLGLGDYPVANRSTTSNSQYCRIHDPYLRNRQRTE